jgi:L-threonylcarbamoyladenylate synthase
LEAAANLFEILHELDSLVLERVYAERVPDEGLGAAINDRLYKARSAAKPKAL